MIFTNMSESVAEHLRSLIIDQKLRPGQKLNEIKLSSDLGISRSPLREAFRVLCGEHLVEIVPRKGSYVTPISMDDCLEIFEAREMIEFFAVDLMERKGVRNLPAIERALSYNAELEVPGQDADPAIKWTYMKHIADFHFGLVEASKNSKLISYYQYLFPNMARYQAMFVFIDGLMQHSQADHEEIYNLIISGKYKEAKKFLRQHIRSWPSIIEEKIAQRLRAN